MKCARCNCDASEGHHLCGWCECDDRNRRRMALGPAVGSLTRRKHELKTLTEFFPPLIRGEKTFEIRVNDRDYKVGDVLHLREWIPCPECNGTRRVWPEGKRGASHHCLECSDMPHPGIYTGEECERVVTYITNYGQTGNRVVMGLSENIKISGGTSAAS